MQKRAQNRVAESRYTLPVTIAFAVAVWIASGLLIPHLPVSGDYLFQGAWMQFVSFLLSALLLVELNNSNALIRVSTGLVSGAFVVLVSTANFLLGSIPGAIVQLCLIASFITFFRCYQDKHSTGWTFYTFLFIGLSSTVFVQILFYVPVLWLIMRIQLACFSWRTLAASILGLLTPYWFILPIAVYQQKLQRLLAHFDSLLDLQMTDYSLLTVNQMLTFAFVVLLALTGIIHYYRNSLNDKFRIRQLFGCFTSLVVFSIAFILFQPQHLTPLMYILIITTSPLIAHFLTLTYTRITNYAFFAICAAVLVMTFVNLWMPSLTF